MASPLSGNPSEALTKQEQKDGTATVLALNEKNVEDGPSSPESNKVEQSSPRSVHGIAWGLVTVATLSSILLYALDSTIVANIIPSIVDDLGHIEQLGWLSVGFMIGGLCVALPIGKVYGIFDAKWLYLIFVLLFLAGSALCGAAPNVSALIVGRVIAGIGGNGMYVGVLTLISVNTSEKERPIYLSLIGLVYGCGTVVGPIIGGAFAQSSATWRWGFYINLVIGAVITPVCALLIPSFDPQPTTKFSAKFLGFDYLGMVLQIGFFVSGIMAINFGGTTYAWNSGQIIALFVVSAVLLILFAVQQSFTIMTDVNSRMFPVHFLGMKEPVLLFILMAACNAACFVLTYYIPLYFQFTRGVGSLSSGVRLLAFIITIMAMIMVNGAVLSQTGHYQPWYIFGAVLILIGGVLISRIGITTSTGRVYGYEVLLGIGVGSYLQAGYAVIQGVLDQSHMSYAVTFMLLGQLSGIALGLSVSAATFVNTALDGLTKLFPGVPREELQYAISGTSSTFLDSLRSSLQVQALEVIMASLQKIFILVYVAGAVSLVASLFLSRKKLNLGPPS